MAYQDVRTTASGGHRVLHSERRRPVEAIIINVVYFVFGVIVTLLAIRFLLLLFGANPAAGFTQIIYGLTAPLMAPFNAVFGTTQGQRGATFEWSCLLAIAIYSLIAWGIAALIDAVSPRSSAGTVETVEEYRGDAEDQGAQGYDQGQYVERDDTYVDQSGNRRVPPSGPTVVRH